MDLLFCAKAIDTYFLHTKITFAFEMFECQSFVMNVYSSIHNLYVILDIIHHIRKIKISNGCESSFMDTGTHVAMGVALGGLATRSEERRVGKECRERRETEHEREREELD